MTILVAALDLEVVVGGAALWRLASAERHGDNMPWAFGATVVLAFLALATWRFRRGRRREALAVSTVLVLVLALIGSLSRRASAQATSKSTTLHQALTEGSSRCRNVTATITRYRC